MTKAMSVGMFGAAFFVSVFAPAAQAKADAPAVASTDAGDVRGAMEDGVISWKGIPFAKPPVGDLRWRAPQPPTPWIGIRDTQEYANDCMQLPFPSDAAPLGTPPAEDCLYLNVWAPAGETKDLPVLVWIYGGGFVNGGSSPPTYSGAEMAKKGVIFVSMNYRVGRFGFFAHPALSAANEDDGLLANYGYMDQLAALKWVQDNIAEFGGDPNQVTIVGESAGGGSVHNLVTSPMSEGTFNKAVVMSGGNGGSLLATKMPEAEKIGVAYAETMDIAANDPDALAKLRALSAEQVVDGLNLTALFRPSGPRTYSGPVIDGKITVNGDEAYSTGAFEHVPMMIGATSGDIGGKLGPMIAGARDIEREISGQGVPVYAYRFSYIAEKAPVDSAALGPVQGAPHASDIPYFFDTQDIRYGKDTTARDNRMGDVMSTYLANFTKAGDPNGGRLPSWPRYDASEDVIIDFAPDGRAKVGKDPWGAEIDETRAAATVAAAQTAGVEAAAEGAEAVPSSRSE